MNNQRSRASREPLLERLLTEAANAVGKSGVLWSTSATSESARDGHLLLLLHGATSNERDLFDRLVPLLPPDFTIVSPRGPVQEGDGYSWVPPEVAAQAITDRAVAAVGDSIARSALAWLDTLPAFATVGVLGASQGACIAFQMLRAAPIRLRYVVNLSGYALPSGEDGDRALQRTRPPVFWGHGIFDDVIPPAYIARTAAWLAQHSTLTERTYDIGHNVTASEMADVAAFVEEQTTANR